MLNFKEFASDCTYRAWFYGALSVFISLPLILFVPTVDLQILSVGLIVAACFVIVFRRHIHTIHMVLLTLSLLASSRLRLDAASFHEGGAELALAPIDVPILILTGVWIVQILGSRRVPRLRWTSVDSAIAFFLLIHLVAAFGSQAPYWSWLEVVRLLKMILLLVLIRYSLRNLSQLRQVLRALLLVVIFVSLLAAMEWLFTRTFGLGFLGERDQFWVAALGTGRFLGRVGSTLGHPNALSAFLAALLPLALTLFLLRPSGELLLLAIVTMIIGVVAILFTFTRAGWLALAFISVFILTLFPFFFGRSRHWFYVVSILSLFALFVLLLFGNLIVLRLQGTSANSELLRVELGRVALAMFQDEPILGVGPNSFVELMTKYDDTGITRVVRAPVHNVFLIYLAELGLPGLFSFVGVFGSLPLLLWKNYRKARWLIAVNPRVRLLLGLQLGLVGGLLGLFIQGSLDWLFRYDPIFTLAWFMLGLVLAIDRILGLELVTR